MNRTIAANAAKRGWVWVAILTALLCLWPVEYRSAQIALLAGLAATWAGALILWWQRRAVRVALIAVALLPTAAVCLPGRAADPDALAGDYARSLRIFRGVHYVWGGEGLLGTDCSGLVEKGLIYGQMYHGLRTLNGRPIRAALTLWWHRCSALALRDGYRGWTAELFRHSTIADADPARLRPGDLAVTADGAHVLAYLGNRAWIEADPDEHQVIEVTLPTANPWFHIPVVFVRWKWFDVRP